MTSVEAGAQAPERLRLLIDNADLAAEPLDLSTVTAVALEIVRPDGARYSWATEIVEQTAEALLVEHAFEADDVFLPGTYRVNITLTVSAGVRRAGPTVLVVT